MSTVTLRHAKKTLSPDAQAIDERVKVPFSLALTLNRLCTAELKPSYVTM